MDNDDFIKSIMEHIDEHGFDVNERLGNHGRSILHLAARSGHQAYVEKILNVPGVEVNSQDEDGKTPLHLAIYAGHREIVDMLLSVSDTDVNLKDNEGAYPLHWAAKLGYATIVEKILKEKDGDVNCTDNAGMTPLHWVAKTTGCNRSDLSDYAPVVEKILAAPNVDAGKEDNNEISPLRMAILHDQYVIAEMILKALGKDFVNNNEVVEESILHSAAREGKAWVVKMIVKMSGVHVNYEDIFQMTSLHLAAMEGQSEVVDVLLGASGVLMNCKDTFGMTPLHWAAMQGHHAVVKTLCSQIPTVDVNNRDGEGKTPLHLAVEKGQEAVVKELLEHPEVDLFSEDSHNLPPLFWAVYLNRKAIVQMFLNKLGKNYFMQEQFSNGEIPVYMAAAKYRHEMVEMLQESRVLKVANGTTLLHCASEGGHTWLVKVLLKVAKARADEKSKVEATARGINYKYDDEEANDGVNSQDEDGKTPLHLAIYAGHKEIVDMLLSVSDTDVNLKDNEGACPLHWAAKLGYATIVEKILKEKNGDVNCTDNSGMTPLHWAAKSTECNNSDHVAVVEKILAAPNVDAGKRDSNEISPLTIAIMYDQYVIAERILQTLGEDFLNNCEPDEESLLHSAAAEGKTWVVEMILKIPGVDVNIEDRLQRTPLHFGATEGHSDVVDVLLGATDVSINFKDILGMTPLHLAAMQGHDAVVKTLCSKTPTVDVNNKDGDGKTPLHLAVEKGHEAVVEEILKHLEVGLFSEDSENLPPLYYAIKLNHREIVQMFLNKLDKDYFMQERFSNGETPMHLAAAMQGHEMLKMLLDSGVLKDADGMTALHCASEGGHTTLVETLLKEAKHVVNRQDKDGKTPLHLAMYAGHKDIVDMLLSFSDTDVNLKDNEGAYPLHWAAKLGYAMIVEKILKEKDGDVNCTDNAGMTPLHWVAKNTECNRSDLSDHAAVVEKILAAPNVDAGKRDKNKISPFMMAAMHDQYVIAKMILKALGKDFLKICIQDGKAPLHWAATEGKTWVLKMILKISGVDVNLSDINHKTPLHWAAMRGHHEVVAIFLRRGVSIDCKDATGLTPLHWAAGSGHQTVVKTLCSIITNVIVNDKDGDGKTPLHLAVEKGHEEVVKEIMKVRGVDLVNEDFDNECPLYKAVWINNAAIVQMFLEAIGKDHFVNKTFKNGKTLMHLAAMRGHAAMVKKLSEAGLDATVTDADEMTPLHWASQRGHAAAVQTLLEIHPADVNCENMEGMTPLYFAVLSGDEATVRTIITVENVDVNRVDKYGKTPLHWAVDKGNREILFTFLKKEETRLVEDNKGKTALECAFELPPESEHREIFVRYLSESSIGKAYLKACFTDRQVYMDASNAILVGAALIAGVTFASWLQPPLGYNTYYEETLTNPYPGPPTSYPSYVDFEHHKALQAFWIFNSLSFFFSASTMVMGARSVLPMQTVFLRQAVRKIRLYLLITAILLFFSILFGTISFSIAGYIVIPPKIKFQANIFSTIAVGGFICLITLYCLGRSIAGELKPLIIVGELKPLIIVEDLKAWFMNL